MEVLSFFSSRKNLVDYFSSFINNHHKLVLGVKDEDTLYFVNPRTNRNEIYFHFVPNDIEHDFSFNYSETERKNIENFFGRREFFSFDIQFRDEKFISEFLKDFSNYLEANGWEDRETQILISHPHKGIVTFDKIKAI